jgi:hypothetical protein
MRTTVKNLFVAAALFTFCFGVSMTMPAPASAGVIIHEDQDGP